MEFKDKSIENFNDVEKFLSNFIWDAQFSFEISSLELEKAPADCTNEGKLRHCLRLLFEKKDGIKQFLISNWHSNINDGDWQLRLDEHRSLLACIERCIPYLDNFPIMKENLINRIISSHVEKSKPNKYSHNYEIDPTWDGFIKDCNEQFNSMMDDMDAWGNID